MFLNAVDSTKTGFTRFDFFAGCGAVCCLAWLGVIDPWPVSILQSCHKKKDLHIETMPDIVTC